MYSGRIESWSEAKQKAFSCVNFPRQCFQLICMLRYESSYRTRNSCISTNLFRAENCPSGIKSHTAFKRDHQPLFYFHHVSHTIRSSNQLRPSLHLHLLFTPSPSFSPPSWARLIHIPTPLTHPYLKSPARSSFIVPSTPRRTLHHRATHSNSL